MNFPVAGSNSSAVARGGTLEPASRRVELAAARDEHPAVRERRRRVERTRQPSCPRWRRTCRWTDSRSRPSPSGLLSVVPPVTSTLPSGSTADGVPDARGRRGTGHGRRAGRRVEQLVAGRRQQQDPAVRQDMSSAAAADQQVPWRPASASRSLRMEVLPPCPLVQMPLSAPLDAGWARRGLALESGTCRGCCRRCQSSSPSTLSAGPSSL